jgi:hypothetical protein
VNFGWGIASFFVWFSCAGTYWQFQELKRDEAEIDIAGVVGANAGTERVKSSLAMNALQGFGHGRV